MISASKTTLTHYNPRFSGPKLRKILRICVRSFANFDPGVNFINISRTNYVDEIGNRMQLKLLRFQKAFNF